jgi:hypothetical protein
MSEFSDAIKAESSVWRCVQAYAEVRQRDLTAICISQHSSDVDIRKAQACIDELSLLLAAPTAQARTVASKSDGKTIKRGY